MVKSKFMEHFKVKEMDREIEWTKLEKKYGGRGMNELLSIRHFPKESKEKKLGYLIFSKRISLVLGDYKFVELLYKGEGRGRGMLGVKFLGEDGLSMDSYKISRGTKKKDIVSSRIFLSFKPKYYMQEEIKVDLKNKILVVPVDLEPGAKGLAGER